MNKIRQFPLFLVTIGIIFLLETTNLYNGAFVKLWPIILVVIGAVKIINSIIN